MYNTFYTFYDILYLIKGDNNDSTINNSYFLNTNIYGKNIKQ